MALPVYSTPFFHVRGLSGAVTYTVPSGLVAVVRDIDIYSANGSPGNTVFRLEDGSSGATVVFLDYGFSGSGMLMWRGRQVWNAGQSFVITQLGDLIDVNVSGYLLTAT